MSNPDETYTEQLSFQEVAQQMANVAHHLREVLDDESHLSGNTSEGIELRLQQAKQSEIQRRTELELKRDKAKEEFAARWKHR